MTNLPSMIRGVCDSPQRARTTPASVQPTPFVKKYKQVCEALGFQLIGMLFDEHKALDEPEHHEQGPAQGQQDHHEQDPAQDVAEPAQDIPVDF